MIDFNKDSDGKPAANKLYRNNHDGSFTDVSSRMGLIDKDHSSIAARADYDNNVNYLLFT